MKRLKVFILVGFVVFAVGALFAPKQFIQTARMLESGPPAARTGAPGEITCTECHTPGEPKFGSFSIITPDSYTPGQTYVIAVRLNSSDPSRRRWGFELTALAGNEAAGTFKNLTPFTQTLFENSRNYIEHTAQGTFPNQLNGAQWSFEWTAPDQDVGTVIFYAAGNQADGNGTAENDEIYTTNKAVDASIGATPTPTPSPTPTPDPFASVSGRVLTPENRGIRGAVVTLIDGLGNRKTTTTSPFGFYSFGNVATGQQYTVQVSAKRYRFSALPITVNGNVINADFNGEE